MDGSQNREQQQEKKTNIYVHAKIIEPLFAMESCSHIRKFNFFFSFFSLVLSRAQWNYLISLNKYQAFRIANSSFNVLRCTNNYFSFFITWNGVRALKRMGFENPSNRLRHKVNPIHLKHSFFLSLSLRNNVIIITKWFSSNIHTLRMQSPDDSFATGLDMQPWSKKKKNIKKILINSIYIFTFQMAHRVRTKNWTTFMVGCSRTHRLWKKIFCSGQHI